MPSYTYQDRDAGIMCLPPGDYVFGVEYANLCLSKAGNDQIETHLRILSPLPKGATKGPMVYDYLVFGEKAEWKIDCFLKCIKKAPKKGAEFDITNEWLEKLIVGSLGWASFVEDEYQGKKKNKVAFYITAPNDKQPDPYKMFQNEDKEAL